MGLFTTRQLLGYTEQKVKFRALFLELFFRRTVNFHTEEVMLDKITGKTPVAAYVSPVVEGKVLRHRGGETRVLRPGYVKPKHEFNYQQAVERLPGEDPAQLNDPAYRRLRIITDNLKQEEHAIVQVEEMQAVNAVLYGKYTMEGDQFEKIEVDFGRSTKNNIIQGSGKEWSKQDRDTFDPTYDIDLFCDQASGLVNIAIMDGTWRATLHIEVFLPAQVPDDIHRICRLAPFLPHALFSGYPAGYAFFRADVRCTQPVFLRSGYPAGNTE